MFGGTDHYAVLGLSPSADDVVVHAAWKALLDFVSNQNNLDSILAGLDKVQATAYHS